jgi:ABC-type Na+ efflux pump permease subunit
MFKALNDGMNSTLGFFLIAALVVGALIGLGIFKYFVYIVCIVIALIFLVAIWVVCVLMYEMTKTKKSGWW